MSRIVALFVVLAFSGALGAGISTTAQGATPVPTTSSSPVPTVSTDSDGASWG